ncbi:hypothetical protein EDB85DRAFT_2151344 [Lactarius pseudohatsudake]|nr:hypothetical protein EDB85DRAFT_2151344 [Lactarius pseudohatsudake]
MRPSLPRRTQSDASTLASTSVLATSSLHNSKVIVPVFGAGDWIGEGDTYLVEDVLPPDLADVAFENLRKEYLNDLAGGEVPRLVAVEGEIDADGNYLIYRHPADESPALHPFSPAVSRICAHVERAPQHPVNHVLYCTGTDYISEHSDKTIDVVCDSRIGSLHDRDRPQRRTQCVPLSHNSHLVMGLQTNARWMHSTHTDKRPDGHEGPRRARISPTFRCIGTFLTAAQRIYGQGATGTEKTCAEVRPVVLGGAAALSIWRREPPERV